MVTMITGGHVSSVTISR